MNARVIKFLKDYSTKEDKVDSLIVTAFVQCNKIVITKNVFLKSYIIPSSSKNWTEVEKFIKIIKENKINFDTEFLIELFEFIISPEDKVINGAVYTPIQIRKDIVTKVLSDVTPEKLRIYKVGDISCGCGGFLHTTAQLLKSKTGDSYQRIFKTQLFGLDIEKYSITRSKLLLVILAVSEGEDVEEFEFNLFEGNALKFDWENVVNNFLGFNVIVGNPPYVCSRNISEASKKLLNKWSVCSSGHPDLYIPFFQIALENLVEHGILGFITMSTFFKSINGRSLRKYFQEKSFAMQIVDFGAQQVFRSRSTYTCICIIRKTFSPEVLYVPADLNSLSSIKRDSFNAVSYSTMNWMDGWNLQANELITKIESTGIPLQEKYTTRNGIATLKNNVYIFKPTFEDEHYFYLDSEATQSIEKCICKDIVNPNLLIEEPNLRNIREKIIFPYEYENEKAVPIKEAEFRKKYPAAYMYLLSRKKILETRDKGGGADYPVWYAYGRNQSLEKIRHKLFFPHITPKIPNYTIDSDENLLFYNGIAVVGTSRDDLRILKKLMQSRLFWFYIRNSSRPYGSGYYSLSKNYIKNFGIYPFTKEDEQFILGEKRREVLDSFFEKKYSVSLPKTKTFG